MGGPGLSRMTVGARALAWNIQGVFRLEWVKAGGQLGATREAADTSPSQAPNPAIAAFLVLSTDTT
jgi:hypothetical protein